MDKSLMIRVLATLIPLACVRILWLWCKPDRLAAIGALAATGWNFLALLLLNWLSVRYRWWSFEPQRINIFGMPPSFYLGWALYWGAIPFLAFPRHHLFLIMIVVMVIDIVLMPLCAPVLQLEQGWLKGDVLGVFICFLPAQLLALKIGHKRPNWSMILRA
jgi:cobalamin synthase